MLMASVACLKWERVGVQRSAGWLRVFGSGWTPGQVSGSLCICGPSWKPPAYISQSVKWDYLTGASSGGTVIEIKGHDMGFVLSIMPGTKERNVL